MAAVKGPVGKLGGAWMFDAEVNARGAELGLNGWSWYHLGRGGVLGDTDASVVVAAFGFFPPALLTKAWDKGRQVMPASEAAREYAAACAAWGRRTFPEDCARTADLLTHVVDAVDVCGMPLFAGWRAQLHAGPDDAPARLALALQAAREHRGSAHLAAVVAAGVPPLQAVMSGRYGAANAEMFGWPQPWPDPAEGKEAMAAVEVVTDAVVAPAYAALPADERAELAAALRAL